MLIEINLSQIRISDRKREKVFAVCPYLLFLDVMIFLIGLKYWNDYYLYIISVTGYFII